MVNFSKLNPKNWIPKKAAAADPGEVTITRRSEASAYSGAGYGSNYTYDLVNSFFGGDKFPGGFGVTKNQFVDYWSLRLRSVQLFTENPYAIGLIKRLITNIINTGLQLEATPVGSVLGMDDEEVNKWAENTEELFKIYSDNKFICDWKHENTFGQLQQMAKLIAFLSGDIVVVLRQSTATRLPKVEIVDGVHVVTPNDAKTSQAAARRGNKIIHGVELDKNNRHVAYYINTNPSYLARNLTTSEDAIRQRNIIKRIPVKGEKSGRLISFMVYGSKKRVDEVRGMPILAAVLQSLKEIDRYRDSEQRAAVINSLLALFIKKDKDLMGSKPVSGGAVRKDTAEVPQEDGTTKNLNLSSFVPGIIAEELQVGETPQSFDTKRPNVNFKAFEDVIVSTMAWSLEIPPEILLLSFNSNYSASQAAISEFKMFMNKERSNFSIDFDKPIYSEWLVSMVLIDRLSAPGLLESWRSKTEFFIFGAWIASDWTGAIKPSVDLLKTIKYYKEMLKEGLVTHDRAAKELNGMKFTTIVRILKKENEQLAEAMKPLLDAGLFKTNNPPTADIAADMIEDLLEEKLEESSDNQIIPLSR